MEEGQNLNDHPTTLSEVEHYYQEREQRLLEKLHQQEFKFMKIIKVHLNRKNQNIQIYIIN